MDQILRSLLESNKKDNEKQAVIKQIIAAGSRSNSIDVIKAMLKMSVTIMLQKSDPLSSNASKDIYIAWAKSNRATLAEFMTTEIVADIMEQKCKNPDNVSFILNHSFKMLSGSYPDRLPNLEYVVESRAVYFVEHNQNFSAMYPFCQFLLESKRCIPQESGTAKFCCALLHAATYFDCPKGLHPQKYITRINGFIAGLLQHIFSRCDSNTIMICLKTVFDIIQTVDDGRREKAPSQALAGLVQYIPGEYIEGAIKTVVSDHSIGDANMEIALTRMIHWLHWPSTQRIDLWLVAFLRGLANTHKYTMLINVTEQSVEKVFECLFFTVARGCAFVVFSHMLLSFQHSPEAFHKVADKVPSLLQQLGKEMIEPHCTPQVVDAARDFSLRLGELLHCLMQLHPGFPDIYEPILEELKNHPKPSAESVHLKLTQNKWGSRQQQSGSKTSSLAKWLRKSDTGKIGLLNLGNTCYMNSVIQAIFMCDSFRQELLTSTPGPSQLLLVKLQHACAFLSASNRAFYSPSGFLSASRPAWFTAGHQQDCSEFLKYLLDQLHEQEMQKKRLEKSKTLVGEFESSKKEKKSGFFSSLKHHKDHTKTDPTTTPCDEPEPSLIQRTFGGKMLNTYTCFKCKNQSSRYESFTDIALPFPEDSVNKSSIRRSERKAALAGGSSSNSLSSQQGKNNASSSAKSGANSSGKNDMLILQDLLADYLKPEKLEGDNKYHCDQCKTLQEAERTVNITQSPEYLILTLLRFAYDVKTHSRSKIFTDVRYPKTLYVPVNEVISSPQVSPQMSSKKSRKKSPPLANSPSSSNSNLAAGPERMDVYALSAVIVHSGLTIDGGHYYCYARHSLVVNEAENAAINSKNVDAGDMDYLQDKWYLFNDSRVTYSGYSSFSDITQKFAKDTAYVLVYKKITAGDISMTVDPNTSIVTQVIDPPLRRDLREAVDKDNKLYVQEQEYEERRRLNTKRQEPATWFWKDSDDQGPPGSCGGGGGGGFGGLNQGPSFVF